jgi:hypothetical protein
MPTTSSTTLSAAITADAQTLTVASATGIAAPTGNANRGTVLALGDGPAPMELVEVTGVSGTTITVKRAYRSLARAWPSSQRVWIGGADGQFASVDPTGAQTSTANLYLPRIVPSTGSVWNVVNGVWVKVDVGEPSSAILLGTVGTNVTAEEFGDDVHHVTKLTLTATTVYAVAGAAAEAIGVLIYTFPAGALIVRGCSISIGLTNTDTNIDADTPDLGIGTVIATGAVAVLGGTATFENIMTGQTMNNCTGTAEVNAVGTVLAIPAASAHTVHLNVADTWAGAETALVAAGTIWLEWTHLA